MNASPDRIDIMTAKQKIMVVDDEPMNREILEEILASDYEVTAVESGNACLELVEKISPKAILLDINMPDMSGYEVCNRLKNTSQTANIPVTFVSALDTLAERLAGYEAGAEDYITKPFDSAELLSKVKVIINNQKLQDDLKSHADDAMSTAMAAMTTTSELGVVMQFLQATFGCDDLQELAEKAVEALTNFGLRSTVQIRVDGDVINFSSDGSKNPLESTVIQRIYKEKRIFDMGQRTIFNYEHVSLLAKGLPLDDPDKCGRYKDHLAVLAEGCEERVQSILMQEELKRKQNGLVKMVENTREALALVDATHEEHKIMSIRILTDLIVDAESSFAVLGLSEDQERSFLDLISNAVNTTLKLYSQGLDIDSHLQDVMDDVKDIMAESNTKNF